MFKFNMDYLVERTLGKTRLKVRRLGFGGIPIQRISEKESLSLIFQCYQLGINFFDTARAYTTSEERIGKALKSVREEVYIASKSVKRIKQPILDDLETTLKNLQSNYVDLYQFHQVNKLKEWNEICGSNGALDGVCKAKEEGKIRHIGVTSHDPELCIKIIEEDFVETLMINYNYLTLKPADKLLSLCQEKNVGTIIMKPYGGGALSRKDIALKFVLFNSDVDVVIPGVMSIDEVLKNIEIANSEHIINDDDKKFIEKEKTLLGDKFCRACDYCRPCPKDIPISFVLRGEELIKLSGWTPNHVKQLPEIDFKVKNCLQCGECEKRCPYQLPIRFLLPKKMRILNELFEKNIVSKDDKI